MINHNQKSLPNSGPLLNWHKLADHLWVGVLNGHALAIQETPSTTLFAHLSPAALTLQDPSAGTAGSDHAALEAQLRDYFQLKHSLAECYRLGLGLGLVLGVWLGVWLGVLLGVWLGVWLGVGGARDGSGGC